MMKVLDRLVDWWMRRCRHADVNVAADILEGGWDTGRVAYCRRCGAVSIRYDMLGKMSVGEWRRPRPLWHSPDGGER